MFADRKGYWGAFVGALFCEDHGILDRQTIQKITKMFPFINREETSNDIIAGNGRDLKLYLFIVWLYLLKKYIFNVNDFFFFLLMHHNVEYNA